MDTSLRIARELARIAGELVGRSDHGEEPTIREFEQAVDKYGRDDEYERWEPYDGHKYVFAQRYLLDDGSVIIYERLDSLPDDRKVVGQEIED